VEIENFDSLYYCGVGCD